MIKLPQKIVLIVLLSLLASVASAETIILKFNNHLNETIYIYTSQFGGNPQLIENVNLTKNIVINKNSSGQVSLFDDAPWLLWTAKIREGEDLKLIDEGKKKLNKNAQKFIEIDINPRALKQTSEEEPGKMDNK